MEFEHSSLPYAHQQIRLGDIQASAHKWLIAIDYYTHAIKCFQEIQNTLQNDNLISVLKPQIIQCEKAIHLCRLKDRSEQVIKAERLSKLTRAHSTSNIKSSTKTNRILTRHNTIQIENNSTSTGMDSFAAFIFSKNTQMNPTTPIIAKKNEKHDAHKIEELQMSYEALKTHLKAAFDDIERLKYENNQLRIQQESNIIQEQNESSLLSNSDDDEEDQETELEATL
ncbi:unnamed protein product [Adineta steineri]|uniref:Uncharacterized protein n=1 Tax=Adineta steineri TaxID=433720 RepID=A0A814TLC8_9BILA|nr:unnamed protein product [Adineta steineri]CAF1269287.1 unnamed protein product [Adineta steineri]